MTIVRYATLVLLALVVMSALLPQWFATSSYDEQFRADFDAPPSWRFPLGTDELGRDRFARLLYGTRTSLVLAPVAAAAAVLFAAGAAVTAGVRGRLTATAFDAGTDLFASLPWLFLLITARSAMPLDAPPLQTAIVTYGLLAGIGWAAPARVLKNAVRGIAGEDYVLEAHACGVSALRLYPMQVVPNLWPILISQFLVSIPVFILGEANLGLLGLGVSEPMPSLGGLLRDLENCPGIFERPWVLAPIGVLVIVVGGLQVLSTGARERIRS